MEKARQILGVQQRFLGFVDSGLPESEDEPLPEGCFAVQPLEVAARPLVNGTAMTSRMAKRRNIGPPSCAGRAARLGSGVIIAERQRRAAMTDGSKPG